MPSKSEAPSLRTMVNGKLVYWILTVVVGITGYLATDVLGGIRNELHEIRKKTDGIPVLELRINMLEKIHDRDNDRIRKDEP